MDRISTKSSELRTNYVRECVEERLEQCGGNRTKTAQSLGVSIRTLRLWLRGTWPYDHCIPAAPVGVEPTTTKTPTPKPSVESD